jgi:hypothetical protein
MCTQRSIQISDFIVLVIMRVLLMEEKKSKSKTYKKENQIFLIYKEIQSGAVAKSYMRKGFPICI